MHFSEIDFTSNKRQCSNCSNCGSDIHKKSTCPLLPCNCCGQMGHTSTTCPTNLEGRKLSNRIAAHRREQLSTDQIQRQNERHRIPHMSEEQIQRQNERHRVQHMSEEQIQRQNERHRVQHMSEEQIQRQRIYRNNYNNRFLSIKQEWDDENPCQYCHCTFLKSVSTKTML